MRFTRSTTLTLASIVMVSLSHAVFVTSALPAFAASALSALDSDKDGTVDLAEAKAAATALFDKLEKDNDGTLDRKELKGRVSKKDWAIADPDNDKTISKDEYLAFVEVAFKRADEDNDRHDRRQGVAEPRGTRAVAPAEVNRLDAVRRFPRSRGASRDTPIRAATR